MTLELKVGQSGIFTLRSGRRVHAVVTEIEGDVYTLRFEHDDYREFRQDGTYISTATIRRTDGTEEPVPPIPRLDIVEWSLHEPT